MLTTNVSFSLQFFMLLYSGKENIENGFSVFSVFMSIFTVILLITGISVQKRWKK